MQSSVRRTPMARARGWTVIGNGPTTQLNVFVIDGNTEADSRRRRCGAGAASTTSRTRYLRNCAQALWLCEAPRRSAWSFIAA